jgi:hypothetical protein
MKLDFIFPKLERNCLLFAINVLRIWWSALKPFFLWCFSVILNRLTNLQNNIIIKIKFISDFILPYWFLYKHRVSHILLLFHFFLLNKIPKFLYYNFFSISSQACVTVKSIKGLLEVRTLSFLLSWLSPP